MTGVLVVLLCLAAASSMVGLAFVMSADQVTEPRAYRVGMSLACFGIGLGVPLGLGTLGFLAANALMPL